MIFCKWFCPESTRTRKGKQMDPKAPKVNLNTILTRTYSIYVCRVTDIITNWSDPFMGRNGKQIHSPCVQLKQICGFSSQRNSLFVFPQTNRTAALEDPHIDLFNCWSSNSALAKFETSFLHRTRTVESHKRQRSLQGFHCIQTDPGFLCLIPIMTFESF